MKHILEDLKETIVFIQYLKTLERNSEAMQRIFKWNFIYFWEISDYPLIVDTHFILDIPAMIISCDLQKKRWNKIDMLIPGDEGLDLPIRILRTIDPLLEFHYFLGIIKMAINAQRTVAVRQHIIIHLRKILHQLRLPIFGIPHLFKFIYTPVRI
jgi:hypothetical protein